MDLRSLDLFDFDLAWRRCLSWAKRRMGVPRPVAVRGDRAVVRRGYSVRGASPPGASDHGDGHEGKRHGLPVIRLPAVDLLVYRALVNAAAPRIEAALLDRETMFAYGLALGREHGKSVRTYPWRRDFVPAAREKLEALPDAYCLRADIAGYFLQVDILELERSLLECGVDGLVARAISERFFASGRCSESAGSRKRSPAVIARELLSACP